MSDFLGQYSMIIFLVLIAVMFYFLMIRPAKKQQQKKQEMMSALQEGTRVMLTSGVYGTIRHLGERQAVIEISPGVDLTVLRAAISKPVGADEDEFEYADAAEPGDDVTPADPPRSEVTGWSLADLPDSDPASVASPVLPASPASPASPTTSDNSR
ncbi:MAG: preprotein translocase subunit YajC [Propionibacteriaceae bacterium]|jgi:preprotein translocase subunit YajC|nr:preprotein translocase subunit YajC [Propionibacteriaceae bacterium]